MAASEPSFVVAGNLALSPEKEEGAGLSSGPERNSAVSSSTPEAPPPAPEPSTPNAAVPEAIPTPPAAASVALELPPTGLGSPPLAEAAPRSPPHPGGSRPGPETFRQRFRQFRYQDAAGPAGGVPAAAGALSPVASTRHPYEGADRGDAGAGAAARHPA